MWGGKHSQRACCDDDTILLYPTVTTADSACNKTISENESFLQKQV